MTHRLRLAPLALLLLVLALPARAQSGPPQPPSPPIPSVPAPDLTVDTTADDQPYDPAASLADCTDGVPDGDCTLREAILVASAYTESDVIGFEIDEAYGATASGLATIQLSSPLPELSDAGIVLDGTTQPGWVAATATTPAALRIVLDGTNAGGSASGLLVSGVTVTVRGLVIRTFGGSGIVATATASGLVVEGNDVRSNGGDGVASLGAPGLRVGTNGDGTDDAAERNVIAGNTGSGVLLSGETASGARVAGNTIGTNAAGDDLGNGGPGVRVDGAPGAVIGGPGADEGNTIRFNGGDGVRVTGAGAVNNAVLSNALSDNGALGIDLGGDGATANDPGDADGGPNGLQNYPLLTSATASGGDVAVAFTLGSTPEASFRVELFASGAADPSGFGEGARFLGATTVATDASGDASGSLLVSGLLYGEVVTATATFLPGAPSVYGGTSEFSAAHLFAAPNEPPVADAGPDQTVAAAGGTAAVTLDGSGSFDPEGDALTYSWAEGGVEIAVAASPTLDLAVGPHTLVLTVADAVGATDTDEILITVTSAGGPAVDLVVTAFTDPVLRGGTLDVFASVENTTAGDLRVRAVLEVEVPGLGTRSFRGRAARVPAGAFVGPGRALRVSVNENAPFGTYPAALVLTDDTTGEEIDREPFTFSVVPGTPLAAFGEDADEPWALSAPEGAALEVFAPEATSAVAAPAAVALQAPAPNPARGAVTLGYEVPRAGAVSLVVYDALGREVAVAASGEHAAGRHTARVDLRPLAPGVYVARLASGGAVVVRRFTVVR